MLLIELDHKSELTELALKDGINTLEEFSIWLIGYTSGFRECREMAHKHLNDEG